MPNGHGEPGATAHPARMSVNEALARPAPRGRTGSSPLAQAVGLGLPARTAAPPGPPAAGQRVAPRVLLAGGHPWSDRARVRAAALWAGDRAVLSGPAAAWWHGMLADGAGPRRGDGAARRGLRARTGVQLRRRDLAATDRSTVRGLRLTGQAADRAGDGGRGAGRLGVPRPGAAAPRRIPAVYRAYCRNLGAHGGAAHRGACSTAAADRADSAAERLMIALLRAAGITGWVLGHPSAAGRSTSPSPRRSSRSRWTAGRGTWTSTVPGRPAQGQRPGPGRVGPAAVHLARPDQPAGLRLGEIRAALAAARP